VLGEKGTIFSNPDNCKYYRVFYWRILENLAKRRISQEYIKFVVENSRW